MRFSLIVCRSTMLALVLLAIPATGMGQVAQSAPTVGIVETSGVPPGFSAADLAPYIAERMNDAHVSGWRFAPPAGQSADPPDRAEWVFQTDPSASGAVRTYGFSRAMMERLIDVRHHVTIRLTFYRHGQYQTEATGQATVGAEPNDPDLAGEIIELTKLVMSHVSSSITTPVLARAGVGSSLQ